MRIDTIEAIPIEIPLKKNFGGSTYTVLTRCTVITRMRTDAGLVSEVYNGDNRSSGREIARLIRERFGAVVAVADRRRGAFIAALEGDPEAERAYEDADTVVFSLRRGQTRS